MKPSEAIGLVKKLVAAFPQRKVAADTVQVYAELLQDLNYDKASRAVLALTAECDWLPTVHQIRERAVTLQVGRGDAGQAWGEVLEAVRAVGVYRTPEFDDPRITAAVASVGWRNICNSRVSDSHVYRAQFERSYKVAQQRALDQGNTEKLLASASQRGLLGLHAADAADVPTYVSGVAKHVSELLEFDDDSEDAA